jgi:hypothetical protein
MTPRPGPGLKRPARGLRRSGVKGLTGPVTPLLAAIMPTRWRLLTLADASLQEEDTLGLQTAPGRRPGPGRPGGHHRRQCGSSGPAGTSSGLLLTTKPAGCG